MCNLIVVVGGKLQPPAIEPEIVECRSAVDENRDGTVITRPGVVAFQLDGDETLTLLGGEMADNLILLRADDQQFFPFQDLLRKGEITSRDFIQDVEPVRTGMWPGDHHATLLIPFGREKDLAHRRLSFHVSADNA